MAQGKKSNNNPENGKKLWMRIVILGIALLMIFSAIILPLL